MGIATHWCSTRDEGGCNHLRLTMEDLRLGRGQDCYELMFKHDISLLDCLTAIEIGKHVPWRRRVRRHVISALAAQGLTRVTGRTLQELVRVG